MSLRLNGLLALAIGVLPISANAATQVFNGVGYQLEVTSDWQFSFDHDKLTFAADVDDFSQKHYMEPISLDKLLNVKISVDTGYELAQIGTGFTGSYELSIQPVDPDGEPFGTYFYLTSFNYLTTANTTPDTIFLSSEEGAFTHSIGASLYYPDLYNAGIIDTNQTFAVTTTAQEYWLSSFFRNSYEQSFYGNDNVYQVFNWEDGYFERRVRGIENISYGVDSTFLQFHVVAVPEPTTYAMLVLGLGLLGFGQRLKR